MSVFPDAKWLDALKLPLRSLLSIALAASILLMLDWWGVLDLTLFGAYGKPVIIILLVISGCLSAVGIGEFLTAPLRERRKQSALAGRRKVRKAEQKREKEEQRVQVLARLDHLSREEMRYVARALSNDSSTFYTDMQNPPAVMLVGKGLVWTPEGNHDQDNCPFSFADFVWAELLRRKDEFLEKEEALQNAVMDDFKARISRTINRRG